METPTITGPSNDEAMLGSDVGFRCEADANVEVDYVWFKGGQWSLIMSNRHLKFVFLDVVLSRKRQKSFR